MDTIKLPSKPEIVPLTEDEKEWMLTIYDLRRKDLFFGGCLRSLVSVIILVPVTMYCLSKVVAIAETLVVHNTQFDFSNPFDYPVLILIVTILVWIISCWWTYYAWALPFKTDAFSGVKERKPFGVVSKTYYPITDQYFVRLNGIDKDYEISREQFNSCEEGGFLVLDQAIKTGYIFCENDHAKTRSFDIRRGDFGWFDYKV